MLSLPDHATLRDVRNDCDVQAAIVRLDRKLAKSAVNSGWWQATDFGKRTPKEKDSSWNWAKLAGACRVDPFAESAAVQTADQAIQGAIIYYLDADSLLEPGKTSVFVHYLATAPWNRDWLVDAPGYRGVGSALLFRAVCHSWLSGLQGRVTLVSLPSSRTREFYEKRSFTLISEDEDGTVEYELEPDAAKRWLVDWGYVR